MDALREPIPRRRVLRIIGGGVLATGAGALVAACGSATEATPGAAVWVPVSVDLNAVPAGTPTAVALSVPAEGSRPAVNVNTWLVKQDDGSVVVYDPRCTHQACAYAWTPGQDRFDCFCHQAAFSKDGAVLFGPPPSPLRRFPTRASASGGLEVEVPGDFTAPKEKT